MDGRSALEDFSLSGDPVIPYNDKDVEDSERDNWAESQESLADP